MRQGHVYWNSKHLLVTCQCGAEAGASLLTGPSLFWFYEVYPLPRQFERRLGVARRGRLFRCGRKVADVQQVEECEDCVADVVVAL